MSSLEVLRELRRLMVIGDNNVPAVSTEQCEAIKSAYLQTYGISRESIDIQPIRVATILKFKRRYGIAWDVTIL